jgi:SAM-dependent methyltransferase
MSTAPDGSPVGLYTRLPELGEGEVVASVLPVGASVLELGCGAGRITRQLIRLGRRFDAVLLASNLVNAEPPRRRAFLETCRRHADLVVVEGLPLAWSPEDGETTFGDVLSRLHVDRVEAGVVHGEMEYEAGSDRWRHSFAMHVFADEVELAAALAEAGLRFERRLDARWFAAVRRDSRGAA